MRHLSDETLKFMAWQAREYDMPVPVDLWIEINTRGIA